MELLGEPDEEKIGYGKYIVECYLSDTWRNTITMESQTSTFLQHAPYFCYDIGKETLKDVFAQALGNTGYPQEVVDAFALAAEHVEPQQPPPLTSTSFEYLQKDLPPVPISFITVRIHDEGGEFIGSVLIYASSLPATVQSLVMRGDEGMFERMIKLIDPGRRKAAILFADLQDSSVLSRRLPSAAYFRLICALVSAIDEVIVKHQGIVGKHAGDGVTAFFLTDDIESPSGTARAAIEAAREIADAASTVAKELKDETGLVDPSDCLVNVGVHWGGTLYMGQLVTGGRLEVTALGDEVNECARIQQSARGGQSLASKTLIEHLSDDDAKALGLDPDGLLYKVLADLPGAGEKAVRDAGTIPVTVL